MGCRPPLSVLTHLPPLESWAITSFFPFMWSHWPGGFWDFTLKAFCVADPLLSDSFPNKSLQSWEILVAAKVCSVAWNALIFVPAFCTEKGRLPPAVTVTNDWLLSPSIPPSPSLLSSRSCLYRILLSEAWRKKKKSMVYLQAVGGLVLPCLLK